jgi:hypothetical protein
MAAQDAAMLRAAFIDNGAIVGLQPDATEAHPRPAGDWITQIAGLTTQGKLDERMYKPEVRINDNLAQVWTYYDFHLGEQFSHCGIDTAQLVRTPDGWKIAMIAYTTRRTGCEPPR